MCVCVCVWNVWTGVKPLSSSFCDIFHLVAGGCRGMSWLWHSVISIWDAGSTYLLTFFSSSWHAAKPRTAPPTYPTSWFYFTGLSFSSISELSAGLRVGNLWIGLLSYPSNFPTWLFRWIPRWRLPYFFGFFGFAFTGFSSQPIRWWINFLSSACDVDEVDVDDVYDVECVCVM